MMPKRGNRLRDDIMVQLADFAACVRREVFHFAATCSSERSPKEKGPACGAFCKERIKPQAASSPALHLPVAASPFMRARCANAAWPAATFAALPDHAFCGAACSARP